MKQKRVLCAAVVSVLAAQELALAVNRSYTGASGGSWNGRSNWNPAVVPPGGIDLEEVNINLPSSGTVNFTSASDYSASRLYWLRIWSSNAANANTLVQSGGTLR